MIDVHAHFADEGYDFPAEWDKIKGMGVEKVIFAADTCEHAAWHRDFCEGHDGAFFTVGIHPEFAASFLPAPKKEGDVPRLPEAFKALAMHKKCVAVGEIGLDYHYPDTDKGAQRILFEIQLLAAAEFSLPIQIHSRDACADTLAVLREHRDLIQNGFLMHCYSYGAENLPDFLELGAYFSFGGVVCFKNARRAVEAAALCPADRILSETDSPYLSPFRGEKNSPANIPMIVRKLAEIKGMSFQELTERIDENAARLFPKLS